MGLDMYMEAEYTLTTKRKKDRQIIHYLNSLNLEGVDSDHGKYLSEYDDDVKPIIDTLTQFKLFGQPGRIEYIKRNGIVWTLSTEAGYWRKANQIHQWFVENAQYGTDDCNRYDITSVHLEMLLHACRTVLRSKRKAAEVLPTASGFFFGGTDYDQYYFTDLVSTVKIIKRALRKSSQRYWKFSYHSSW